MFIDLISAWLRNEFRDFLLHEKDKVEDLQEISVTTLTTFDPIPYKSSSFVQEEIGIDVN